MMSNLSLLLLGILSTTVESVAFIPNSCITPDTRGMGLPSLALQAKRKTIEIERPERGGSFKTEVILPESGGENVKGMAFFMHGFSQYPKAYRKTLETIADETNVGIVAVQTGVISSIVVKGTVRERGENSPQYVLQKAVSEDTMLCMKMVKEGNESFADLGVPSGSLPTCLVGHSMGGGLCYYVASKFTDVNHVFTMAPVIGEEEFAPEPSIEARTPKHSMNLAGNWDVIANSKKVEKITSQCNAQIPGSSMYVEIERGVHTGFEDELVLFNLNLSKARSLVFKILDYSNFTVVLVLNFFNFLRGRTGQIEITRTLMSYFIKKMVDMDEDISEEEVLDVMKNDPDMKEKWVKKVELS